MVISGTTTGEYAPPSELNSSPSTNTAMIGPTELRATRPKLSSPAWLSLRTEATPTPSAIIKGTVIGPVVTPPESKAVERKSFGTNTASANTAT